MKRKSYPIELQKRKSFAFAGFILFFNLFIVSNTVKAQLIFEKEEYASRREKLMEKIPDGILIMRGATMPAAYVQFYQYNDLMYLTGVEIPDVILLVDGLEGESYLFMSIDENDARSEGFNLELVKDPTGVSGIEHVLPLDQMASILRKKLEKSRIVYAPHSPNELMAEVSREKRSILQKTMIEDEWDGRSNRTMQFIHKLMDRFPEIIVRDCSSTIWDLRKIKSEAEIEIMREAGRIGVLGHKAVMKATGIKVTEQYLANLFEFTCKNLGANGLGYNSIIMSGLNHAHGHYHKYDRTLEKDDFIILDAGPDFKYYDVDISTTFPSNGKFNETQKESYELALLVSETCLKNYQPGRTLAAVGQKVKEALIKNGYDPNDARFERWFTFGGYNHSIGMAVHDGMGTFEGTNEVLKPGFVFACDIMTRADSVTSVRIEDTVLITENGCEVLSAGLPRTVKEIESFMKK